MQLYHFSSVQFFEIEVLSNLLLIKKIVCKQTIRGVIFKFQFPVRKLLNGIAFVTVCIDKTLNTNFQDSKIFLKCHFLIWKKY